MAAIFWGLKDILKETAGEDSYFQLHLSTAILSLSLSENMATVLSFASITPNLNSHNHSLIFRQNYHPKIYRFRCNRENPRSNSSSSSSSPESSEPEAENALLKVAWYSSELLGIAASFFRSPSNVEAPETVVELSGDGSGVADRSLVVETIKDDFQRSYFVTG